MSHIPSGSINSLLILIKSELDIWNYRYASQIANSLDESKLIHESDDSNIAKRLLFLSRAYITFAQTESSNADHITTAMKYLMLVNGIIEEDCGELWAEYLSQKTVLTYLETGSLAALAILSERSDPYATRTRAAIYLKQEKLHEALAELEGRETHSHWCDLAVTIYGLNDRFEKALELVQWASKQPDPALYPQCCVRFAQAGMARLSETHSEQPVQPESISQDERKRLEQMLRTLEPVLDPIQAAGKPDSELDLAALRCALQAHHLLRNREEIQAVLLWMYQWTPVPIEVAQGVTSGYWHAPEDLAQRLWDEHAGDLDAGIMTVVILASAFQKPLEALERLEELVSRVQTEDQRNQVFRVAFQLRQNLEADAAIRCEVHLETLAEHNPLNQALLRAAQAVQASEAGLAISLLDEQRAEDDFYWLQLRAKACLQRQEFKDAVRWLHKGYDLTRDARLLILIADAAYEAEDFQTSAWGYEQLLAAQPDDVSLHGRLAHLYHAKLGDLEWAAVHFRALYELEPGNPTHTRNLALCLAQIFLPEDSLRLFNELCALPEPLRETVLGRAQVLLSLGRSEEALSSMVPFRERFREDVSYWAMVVQAGYAAGQEGAAEDALANLQRLQQAGSDPNGAVKVIPQEEFLAWVKLTLQHAGEKDELVHEQMLQGRMPWVWAAQVAQQPILAEWRRRTLPQAWISEDPINQARFTVYATNEFHAGLSSRKIRELRPIACPPRGEEIVADLSALITLHHLGLLKTAAEYFGKILVPVAYLRTVLEDARKMVPFQHAELSAERTDRLAQAGSNEGITKGSDDTPTAPGLPLLADHAEGEGHHDRFIDALTPLYSSGRLHAEHLDLFRRIRSDQRFRFVPHVVPKEMGEEERVDGGYLPFWSVFVAQQRKRPLLADDRALQAFALNAMGDDPAGAFGTDAFVVALSRAGEPGALKAAQAWVKLLSLRYRFLVPPPELLKTLASQSGGNPPGQELRHVAAYVQDCMRDPGLFNGPEKTDNGESMAIRLYLSWISVVADFLVLVWDDEAFTGSAATQLTDWACRELLPALPLVLEDPMKSRLGEWTNHKLISQALSKTTAVRDKTRMPQAMQAIRSGLRLSDEAYERIITETLRISALQQPEVEEHRQILYRIQVDMMLHAFGPEGSVRRRTFVALRNLDLTLPDAEQPQDSKLLLEVLQDVKHSNIVPLPDGPLLVFRSADDQRRVQVDLPTQLLSESLPMRQAALERLLSENEGGRLEMTAVTRRKLSACRDKLTGETPREWAPAALDAYDALQDDLLLALQGAGQCLSQSNLDTGFRENFLDRILCPTGTALESIQSLVLDPGVEPLQLQESIRKIGADSRSVGEACDQYSQRLGHLPFAPEYSLAAVLGPRREQHPEAPLWEELWAWAHEARSPLASYHACSVFVLHPEWLPPDKLPELWRECLAVLQVADRQTEDQEEHASWALRRDLVRLLSQNLEAQFPGSDSSRTALFAWWWAERVATRLTGGAREAQLFRTNHIQPRLKDASHVRQLGASVLIRSTLSRMIKTHSFPWATALLALLGARLPKLAPDELTPEQRDLLNRAIASCLIDTLPVAFDDPETATFALEYPLGKVAQSWREVVLPDEERSLSGLLRASRDWGTAEGLTSVLRKLPELSIVDRLAVTLALNNRAHCAPETFSAPVLEVLSDATWRKEILSGVDESILDRLVDGFSTLQTSDPKRWATTLPHCLAELCEHEEDENRIRERVFYVLHASLLSDSVSAVRRLLHGENKSKYLKAIEEYRASIQRAWGLYPPWVQGRLRGLLACLYLD